MCMTGVTNSLSRSSDPPGDSFNALLLLSVAYAANIGGMGVVTGTPPNLVALKYLEDSVSFAEWMAICCEYTYYIYFLELEMLIPLALSRPYLVL